MNRLNSRKAALSSLFAVAIVTVLPSTSHAQDSRFYIGGSIGRSQVKIDTGALADETTAAGLSNTGYSANNSDTGWKLFAGYKFHPNFAVEGGYVDLGKFSASTIITAVNGTPIVPTSLTFSIKATEGFFVSGLGIWPVNNQFSMFGKVGGYNMKTEATASVLGINISDNARNNGWLLGLGGQFDFTKNVGLRLEWERFNEVGDKDKTGQGDVGLLSLGLVYRFQ